MDHHLLYSTPTQQPSDYESIKPFELGTLYDPVHHMAKWCLYPFSAYSRQLMDFIQVVAIGSGNHCEVSVLSSGLVERC